MQEAIAEEMEAKQVARKGKASQKQISAGPLSRRKLQTQGGSQASGPTPPVQHVVVEHLNGQEGSGERGASTELGESPRLVALALVSSSVSMRTARHR